MKGKIENVPRIDMVLDSVKLAEEEIYLDLSTRVLYCSKSEADCDIKEEISGMQDAGGN
jgi:hypothetical protein